MCDVALYGFPFHQVEHERYAPIYPNQPKGITMTKKKTTTVDVPTLQQRREMIELVAMDGLTAFGDLDGQQAAITLVLQAICCELLTLSISVEQEITPTLNVVGALTGGLFGAESASTDETVLGLHNQAVRLRAHIARVIGLPVAGGTLAGDEAAAAARREAARPAQEGIDRMIKNLKAKVG